MKDKELSAFKDGVADALLEGYKSDWHENLHFYNQTSLQPLISASLILPLTVKYFPFKPHMQSSSPLIIPISSVIILCPG